MRLGQSRLTNRMHQLFYRQAKTACDVGNFVLFLHFKNLSGDHRRHTTARSAIRRGRTLSFAGFLLRRPEFSAPYIDASIRTCSGLSCKHVADTVSSSLIEVSVGCAMGATSPAIPARDSDVRRAAILTSVVAAMPTGILMRRFGHVAWRGSMVHIIAGLVRAVLPNAQRCTTRRVRATPGALRRCWRRALTSTPRMRAGTRCDRFVASQAF